MMIEASSCFGLFYSVAPASDREISEEPVDIPFAALAPVIILALVFVGYCIFDLVTHDVKHLPKWVWVIIVVISIPLGGIVYLLVGRDAGTTGD